MQDQSALIRTFSQRTDKLAARIGRNLQDLPEIIGISRRTLFECRSADSAVSQKTWAKLEAAERAHGLTDGDTAIVESSTKPKDLYDNKPQILDVKNQHQIPVVGMAHAGEAESYEELPKSWQKRMFTDCRDPRAFAVILEGDSMEPKFSEGDWLIVQPSEVPHSGCLVVARFATDGVIFRRFEQTGKTITLMPLNSRYQASQHTAEEFAWIYPVWGLFRPLWRR